VDASYRKHCERGKGDASLTSKPSSRKKGQAVSHPVGKHIIDTPASSSLESKTLQARPRHRRARHDATFRNPRRSTASTARSLTYLLASLNPRPLPELLSCLLCLPLPSDDASPGVRTNSTVSSAGPWLLS